MTRFPELSGIVEMDSKRLIIFIVLSMGILLLWQEYFAPKPAPQQVAQTQTASQPDAPASHTASAQPVEAAKLTAGQRIHVTTDVIKAEIDTVGGDLRQLDLLKHDSATDAKKPFELLTDKNGRVYVPGSNNLASDAQRQAYIQEAQKNVQSWCNQ